MPDTLARERKRNRESSTRGSFFRDRRPGSSISARYRQEKPIRSGPSSDHHRGWKNNSNPTKDRMKAERAVFSSFPSEEKGGKRRPRHHHPTPEASRRQDGKNIWGGGKRRRRHRKTTEFSSLSLSLPVPNKDGLRVDPGSLPKLSSPSHSLRSSLL